MEVKFPQSRILCVAVGVVLMLAASWGLAAPAQAASSLTLSGTVSAAGNPVAAAVVAVIEPATHSTLAESPTDNAGHYTITGIPAGDYTVEVTPPSETTWGKTTIDEVVIAADTTLDLQLVASDVSTLSGVVRDSAGNPVPGVLVQLCCRPGGGEYNATSGASGGYSLTVSPGSYYLVLQRYPSINPTPPYMTLITGQFSLAGGATVKNLTLPPVVDLTVHVVDSANAPLAGVAIHPSEASSLTPYVLGPGLSLQGATRSWGGDTTTDATGTAHLKYYVSGSGVTLTLTRNGQQWTAATPALTSDVVVTTSPPAIATLSGVVRDNAANPVPGVLVQLCCRPGGGEYNATSDSSGRYSLTVSPGTYYLVLQGHPSINSAQFPPNMTLITGQFDLGAGATAKDLTLPPVVDLTVHVVDSANAPLTGVAIHPSEASSLTPYLLGPGLSLQGATRSWGGDTTTDATGTAHLKYYVSGSGVTLTLTRNGQQWTATTPALTSDVVVTTSPPAIATLSGVVRDNAGNPAPGVLVQLCCRPGGGEYNATSDASGRYSLTVSPGSYYLVLQRYPSINPTPPYMTLITGQFDLGAGATAKDLTLPPVVDLTVHVVDSANAPLTGVTIHPTEASSLTPYDLAPGLSLQGATRSWGGDTTTDATGTAHLKYYVSGSGVTLTLTPPTASGLQPLITTTAPLTHDQILAVRLLPMDQTPPVVTGTADRPANAAGWYNAPVTITWTATDDTDMTLPAPAATLLDTDGANQTATSDQVCDHAHNCAHGTVTGINIDQTPPAVTATVSGSPNANGWRNTPPTVSFTCTDTLSGIATCPEPIVLTTDGANQTVSGTSTDHAGNTTTTTVTGLNLDTAAPTLSIPTWTTNPKPVSTSTTPISTTLSIPATDTLSGVQGGEYYLGADPGQGNGTAMTFTNGSLTTSLGVELPVGVYDIGVRAYDAAGNWTATVTTMLVVYDPTGPGLTGKNKKDLVPSLAAGDTLPGLTDPGQTDTAEYGFTVEYRNGTLDPRNDLHFAYATGTHCNTPNPVNCHQLTLDATAFDWLIIDQQNTSHGRVQGTATLTIDGTTTTTNRFTLDGIDGDRLTPIADDHFLLRIYPPGADPATATPLYQASGYLNQDTAIRIR